MGDASPPRKHRRTHTDGADQDADNDSSTTNPHPPTTATAMADIDTVKDLLALSPDGAAAAGKFKRSTLVKALNAAAESGSHFDEVSPSV